MTDSQTGEADPEAVRDRVRRRLPDDCTVERYGEDCYVAREPGGTVLVDGNAAAGPDPTRWVDRRSRFGNPFRAEKYGNDRACELYEGWFRGCLETGDGRFDAADVESLRGEVIACHCLPRRCHGETILAWLARNGP